MPIADDPTIAAETATERVRLIKQSIAAAAHACRHACEVINAGIVTHTRAGLATALAAEGLTITQFTTIYNNLRQIANLRTATSEQVPPMNP